LHQHSKGLIVHIGGPVRRLIPMLAEAGIDTLEGISGPPQSDCTLAQARELAGPGLTLWGGIPQDVLMQEHSEAAFQQHIESALNQARNDPRMILGVVDRVPTEALDHRLVSLALILRGTN